MALIKCPECNNKISDQADSCPNCGYELHKKTETKKTPKNFDYKYLIIGLLILVVGLYILNQNRSQNTTQNTQQTNQDKSQYQSNEPASNNGYVKVTDKNLKVTYEMPSTFKSYAEKNTTYIGQNIDDQGPLIPYIILGWVPEYTNAVQYLNAFTDELKQVYGNVSITIDLVSGQIGSYYVYGVQYQYYSSNHLVVDNRYAFDLNGQLFTIGTKEENQNSQEINTIAETVIKTLKVGV